MTLPKPFQYKVPKFDRPGRARRIQREKEGEELTGFVNGEPASDLEEWSATVLREWQIDFDYEYEVYTAFTIPHQERKVDFMCYLPPMLPLEIDGEISHKTAGDKEADRVRDATINDALRIFGTIPLERVDASGWANVEDARAGLREVIWWK